MISVVLLSTSPSPSPVPQALSLSLSCWCFYLTHLLHFQIHALHRLLATYAPDPQSSVMKSKAYGNYERFCEDQDKTPAHMLVFSKYLIALFPKLKSRRLGPRGKGVPHYGGIRKRRENR